jgi:solute:Na+ symporter, SSS family
MPTVNLTVVDMMVMAGYIVMIVVWGLIHSKRSGAEGYFLGGRSMGWPLIGISMMAAGVSSSSLVGWSADAYSTGIAVFNYGISGAVVPIVFFVVFFLPFYLRRRIFTLPEFLEGRFDARSRYFFSVLTVIGYTFADAAVTLYAGAMMLKLVFPGVSVNVIVWGLVILATSYTLLGGLSSVMWVDLIQTAVLISGSACLTFVAFSKAGGWHAVMDAVPEGHLHLWKSADDASVPWPAIFISIPLLGFYFWGLNQSMVQRTLSARSVNDGRMGNLFAAALQFVVFFLMVLPGVAGRAIYPDLENANEIYPRMVFGILPEGLTGLVIAGFLAALISTLSSILTSSQTLVTMDIISKLKPRMNGRQLLLAGNLSGAALMVIAAIWAPRIGEFDSVVKYFQQVLSFTTPPVVAVFILGLFWKRATANGAFYGLAGGLGLAVLLMLFIRHTPMADWHFLYVAPLLFALSGGLVAIVSLLGASPPDDAVSRFVWRPSFYSEETASLSGVAWYRNYRIFSLLLLALTFVFYLVWK